MTKRLSDAIATNMISMGVLPSEKQAILSYGMEALISTAIGVLLISVVSAISGEHLAWLFFLLGFAPIRRTAGGYHADTHAGCYFVITAVFIMCTAIEMSAVLSEMAYVIIDVVSALTVLWLSPCIPPNKPLKNEQKHKNRSSSIIFSDLFLVLGLLLLLLGVEHRYVHFAHLGFLSAAVSLVAAKIKLLLWS